MENSKTDTELIAEFMDMIQNPFDKTTFSKKEYYVLEEGEHFGLWQYPDFKNSWDWLMPVVEKIETLAPTRVKIDCNEVTIISNKRFKVHTLRKINSVYQCILQFIEWYNKQPK